MARADASRRRGLEIKKLNSVEVNTIKLVLEVSSLALGKRRLGKSYYIIVKEVLEEEGDPIKL